VKTRGCPATVSPRELRRAIRQAEVLGLRTEASAVTERTKSDLELMFLSICRRHGLPEPEINVVIGSLEVDFLWRSRRLVVETDGYRYHRGRATFERDHERDLRLRALGYDVVRLSEQQVEQQPHKVAGVLLEMLAGA
jgi:very-short-patch-repair endonuclease